MVAPIFTYRSALPMHTFEGLDLNARRQPDRQDRDRLSLHRARRSTGRATFEEDGPCETVNCSRRAPFSQLNLRVSRGFRLGERRDIEAIAEVFNLFNAKNPFIPVVTLAPVEPGRAAERVHAADRIRRRRPAAGAARRAARIPTHLLGGPGRSASTRGSSIRSLRTAAGDAVRDRRRTSSPIPRSQDRAPDA